MPLEDRKGDLSWSALWVSDSNKQLQEARCPFCNDSYSKCLYVWWGIHAVESWVLSALLILTTFMIISVQIYVRIPGSSVWLSSERALSQLFTITQPSRHDHAPLNAWKMLMTLPIDPNSFFVLEHKEGGFKSSLLIIRMSVLLNKTPLKISFWKIKSLKPP